MIFEPNLDGMIVRLDKSEFLDIVNDFIKQNQEEYKKFIGGYNI